MIMKNEKKNDFVPFLSTIMDIIPHTSIEYTFRMSYDGGDVLPGQFFEVSIPKYGEAPISVSGIGEGFIDLTIRRVGKVTNEIFTNGKGSALLLRGPYGNGFHVDDYKGQNLIVIAGGTGVSPVKAVVDYFGAHPQMRLDMTLICGFKSTDDILFRKELEKWDRQMELILTVDRFSEEEKSAGKRSADKESTGEESAGEESTDKETAAKEHPIQSGEGIWLDNPSVLCREGLVTAFIPLLKKYDPAKTQAIVVGPPAMMRFGVAGLLDIGMDESHIWISHERKMCCGLGKCGHCRVGDTYICIDGPVFNYSEGKNLID